MIVADTNILSTFARVDRLRLLLALFPTDTLVIPPAVYDELLDGMNQGYHFLEKTIEMTTDGDLELLPLSSAEHQSKTSYPSSLGHADIECLVLCKERGLTLITNDRRLRQQCRTHRVNVHDLPMLLRALWEVGPCSKPDVRVLIAEIESREGMVLKKKSWILG